MLNGIDSSITNKKLHNSLSLYIYNDEKILL